MIIQSIKTRVFKEGDNLLTFITDHCRNIPEKSIIVITSKIVALAEGRTAILSSLADKEKLIRAESDFALPTKYVWLTVKDGAVMTSAGIDESNANGKFILLPKNGFKTAHSLRNALKRKYHVKDLGVLITDSRTIPFRGGSAGIALGYAGFRGVKDYRGKPDIFGKKLKLSKTDAADSLAAAAVLVMGEGNERQPLAIVKRAPIEFRDRVDRKELHIDIREDVYLPIFSKLSKRSI